MTAYVVLRAVIATVIRRTLEEVCAGELHVGGIHVDLAARTVTVADSTICLSRLEFELLVKFAGDPQRVFSEHELTRCIWGHEHITGRTLRWREYQTTDGDKRQAIDITADGIIPDAPRQHHRADTRRDRGRPRLPRRRHPVLRAQAHGPPEQDGPTARTLTHGRHVTQIRDSRAPMAPPDGSDLRAHQASPEPNPPHPPRIVTLRAHTRTIMTPPGPLCPEQDSNLRPTP